MVPARETEKASSRINETSIGLKSGHVTLKADTESDESVSSSSDCISRQY